MSRVFDSLYFDQPRYQAEQQRKEREINQAWQQYEQQEVPHRLVMDGLPIQYELMTRMVATHTNTELQSLGWKAKWEEVKEPQHISEILMDEFLRLQQSINR